MHPQLPPRPSNIYSAQTRSYQVGGQRPQERTPQALLRTCAYPPSRCLVPNHKGFDLPSEHFATSCHTQNMESSIGTTRIPACGIRGLPKRKLDLRLRKASVTYTTFLSLATLLATKYHALPRTRQLSKDYRECVHIPNK